MNNITPHNNIAFKAKYVNSSQILKFNKEAGEYVKRNAMILEFDPNNKKDLDALVKVAEKWGGAKFGDDIAYTANNLYFNKSNPSKERIFMLTTQNTNYNTPDVKQILGIAQTSCDDGYSICVDYLQTKPNLINRSSKNGKNKEYKHVGEGLLNSIKKTFSQKPIYLYPLPDVTAFYERNGFKEISKNPVKYKWTKELSI